MATIVVAHGAWSAGWSWKKMRPLLAAAGHDLFTPTYTGLGERAHLASPAVDLDTHIADVLGVLDCEDLRKIVLIGHSYGGMVATGIADRAPERIAQLIYLDAFVPRDGQSLFDLLPAGTREHNERQAREEGEGWRLPPRPPAPDLSADDLAWTAPRRKPQPLKTFTQRLRLARGEPAMPRAYIRCTRVSPDDPFRPFAERARREGWPCADIDAGHTPHVTAPQELTRLLQSFIPPQ